MSTELKSGLQDKMEMIKNQIVLLKNTYNQTAKKIREAEFELDQTKDKLLEILTQETQEEAAGQVTRTRK